MVGVEAQETRNHRRRDMPRPIHFDRGVTDPARAIAFYKAAFGWTVRKWNGPFEYS